ncbi:MAG: hypothetical protein NVS2B8_02030 [Vulcanimicrobiaceae bacterium]
MLNDFDAHKAIGEAQERHEHALGHGGTQSPTLHARIVPLAAALLAVVAAIGSLLANQSATETLALKNQAIFIRTEASDSYNFYQAKSIKQHVYEAAIDAGTALAPATRAKLTGIAAREKTEKKPVLARAREQEAQAKELFERSERSQHAHEIMEGGVTLFEVAIAIVSISALTASTFLLGFGGVAAIAGAIVLLYGLLGR